MLARAALLCCLPHVLLAQIPSTQQLAPGVFHDTYSLTNPNVVHVIRADLSRPEYKVQLGLSQKKRNYTANQRVSVIAPQYESPSNHVIAAVNGSYFNIAASDPGISGMLVDAGGYVKMADASREMICLNDARTWAIAQAANSSAPVLTFTDGTTLTITNYMAARASNGVAGYMTTWGPTTGTTNQGVEVIISNVSYPIKPQKQVSGIVTAIRIGATSTNNAIPAGGFVISAEGISATNLLSKVAVGDRVYLKATISTAAFYWANFALSGNGYLLKDGIQVDMDTTKDPQTVLAWNATNFFMMTCDGRQTASIGMSWNDLASFLTNTLQATDAIAMDSGGSTTAWINGEGVVNVPSDGTERAVADAVMLVNAPTASTFPLQDNFPATGRTLAWDDKFSYSAVTGFLPSAVGGDGYVMTVKNAAGGVDTSRVGDLADTDYTVETQIYCEYRASLAANGYERYGIFARDDGNQAFASASYNGNCYAMLYKCDNGQVQAGKFVNGVLTDFLASAPIYITASAWHKFAIRCYGTNIQFLLDGTMVRGVIDTTFKRGYCGIGSHSTYSTKSNIHGTRADNFKAYVETFPTPASAVLGININQNLQATLSVAGTAGSIYHIDLSTNLETGPWTTLTNFVLPGSPFFYTDTNSISNGIRRFYRATGVQ